MSAALTELVPFEKERKGEQERATVPLIERAREREGERKGEREGEGERERGRERERE